VDTHRLKRIWNSRQLGVYLMTFALIGWVVTQITIQFLQAAHFGYGSGIGDGGRVPPAIVEHYGTDDPQELVDKTIGDNWWNVFNQPGGHP
jgi:hypothetical protein